MNSKTKQGWSASPLERLLGFRRLEFVVLALFALVGAGTILYEKYIDAKIKRGLALEQAQRLMVAVDIFRELYVDNVVNPLEKHGVKAVHDVDENLPQIPLPPALTALFAETLALRDRARVGTFSPFGYPELNTGKLTSDQRRLWSRLMKDPDEPAYAFEHDAEGVEILHYAIADRLEAGCVKCHNSDPDSPRHDWRAGDVRGAIEIELPLGIHSKSNSAFEFYGFNVALVFLTLTGAAATLLTRRLRLSREELESRVTERTAQLLSAGAELKRKFAAIQASPDAVVFTDRNGVIEEVNPGFTAMTGYTPSEVRGRNASILKSGQHDESFYADFWNCILAGNTWSGEIVNRYKDGALHTEDMSVTPLHDESGSILGFVAVKRDISARKHMEQRLLKAEKLESIGQLAAGIAHELNTPLQYLSDNTAFLKKSLPKFIELIDACERFLPDGEAAASLQELKERLQYDYLKSEAPLALEHSGAGVDTMSRIVKSMYLFAHPGTGEKQHADLNEIVDNSAEVTRNEWKYNAQLERTLDSELPSVFCLRGEITQVLVNLILNARDAVRDKFGNEPKGEITLSTRALADAAEIKVTDNGAGIPPEALERVFEPFFTTKDVGKGTGQGLAMAYNAIVRRHFGSINVASEVGEGTTVTLTLPFNDPDSGAAEPEN